MNKYFTVQISFFRSGVPDENSGHITDMKYIVYTDTELTEEPKFGICTDSGECISPGFFVYSPVNTVRKGGSENKTKSRNTEENRRTK